MTDVHNDALELEDFDTVISPDIEFTGTLSFDKPVLIQGKVSGEINASSLLMIAEEAIVEANIRASQVIILGTVKGNVLADIKVEVSVSGKLTGNVTAPEINMETGCFFSGRCIMTERR